MHPSVDERFALPAVAQCDGLAPYRPAPLAKHVRFGTYYGEGA